MMSAEPIQLRAQIVQMSKIAYADGPSADLVLIGGANAPARGADLASATRILTQRPKVAVNWPDWGGGFGNVEAVGRDVYALPGVLGHFVPEMPWIEHNTIDKDPPG